VESESVILNVGHIDGDGTTTLEAFVVIFAGKVGENVFCVRPPRPEK
jgi:hypothetical protein